MTMKRMRHFFPMGIFLFLANRLGLGSGCTTEPGPEQTTADSATIHIRFHEGMSGSGGASRP